jgi:hypothetical protein
VIRRFLLLPLLPLLASIGCSSPQPYVNTIGVLLPGSTMTVHVADAPFSAYAPELSQRHSVFTISATALPKGTPPPAPQLRSERSGVVVAAPNPLAALLVRVPQKVDLVVDSQRGDVTVTEISGNVRVKAARGNVTLMVPGYAQASTVRGNLKVTMGATDWPGTLSFSSQQGDVELWIGTNASFTVHLHTDSGTLFTDFGLQGSSSGSSETIDGSVNGGGPQHIDVETKAGAIRLLRLQPQA